MTLGCRCTCEPAGLSQQEGAPGHEEKQSCLQQREVPEFGELGHVTKTESQGAKQKLALTPAAPTTEPLTCINVNEVSNM